VTEEVKFEAKSRPTVGQVERVWNDHPAPSARSVCDLLNQRGFKISWRTVARWKKNNWIADPAGGGKKSIAEDQHTPAPVKEQIREILAGMDPEVVAEANRIAAAGGSIGAAIEGGGLKDADYARIEALMTELNSKSISELRELQEKERAILNIVLMREAARKAHVMTLIPKDTSALVAAFTEEGRTLAAPAPIQPVGDPKLNGHSNGHAIEGEFRVVNPVSDAIGKFLAKENAA
jgi:hypothetical protein